MCKNVPSMQAHNRRCVEFRDPAASGCGQCRPFAPNLAAGGGISIKQPNPRARFSRTHGGGDSSGTRANYQNVKMLLHAVRTSIPGSQRT
jgi:hypothetical protein